VPDEPIGDRPPGIPRWVVGLGVAALIILAALALLVIVGGHDPAMFNHG
jgi:hypothetical protein